MTRRSFIKCFAVVAASIALGLPEEEEPPE
jgi:hypothetical protein